MDGHWRKIVHTDYLSGDEIVDKEGNPTEYTLTIKSAVEEDVVDPRTGAKNKKGVIRFEKTPKGLILNVTNGKMIALVLKTPLMEKWVGRKIVIYGMEDKRHGRVVRVKFKQL